MIYIVFNVELLFYSRLFIHFSSQFCYLLLKNIIMFHNIYYIDFMILQTKSAFWYKELCKVLKRIKFKK